MRFDGGEVFLQPNLEVPGVACVVENKQGRALHRLCGHGGGNATRLADDFHAAIVACKHGAFDGGHGHVELALGVLTINEQGACHANGHLYHAPNILNVSRHYMGIIRILFGVV